MNYFKVYISEKRVRARWMENPDSVTSSDDCSQVTDHEAEVEVSLAFFGK